MGILVLSLLLVLPLSAGTATLEGAKIHYTATGQGGEAIVLIHGWTCDHTLWDQQVTALSRRYRVLALDLPGHGRSDPAPDYSMKRFARAAEAVMRQEKIPRAILAGHSMGGAVMLEFARLFPKKVIAIVAVDAMFPDSASAAALTEFAARFSTPDARVQREKMVRGMFTPATTPDVRAKIEKVMLGAADETAAGAMRGIADASVWKDDVIDLPFLQIAAASSAHLTEEGMKRRFPRAEFIRIPDTGHFLQLERPDKVNEAMIGWLAKLR